MLPTDISLGYTYPERKHHLDELLKTPGSRSYGIKFQGKFQHFPVYPIPIDLPKYRLTNGRTQAAQEDFLAKNPKKGNDFFTKDPESLEAQNIQHKLLLDLVKSTNLWGYFKNTANVQEQPLILSCQGFVVNGNRRLCAMRELYSAEPVTFAHFSHIDVIILPFCSNRDIDELEAHLQIQPEIKAEYSWISLACMLRARQASYGYTNAQLAELYEKTEKEITKTLAQLSLVDDYLTSRGKPKQYELVENEEYAIEQLFKTRQQEEQGRKDLITQISYSFIDYGDSIKGRLYDRIPDVKKHLDVIANKLSQKIDIEVPTTDTPTLNVEIFGVKTQKPTVINNLAKTIEHLDNKKEIVDIVIDAIDEVKESERQKNKSNAVLQQLSEANACLQKALNFISETSTKNGANEQIAAIESALVKIKQWLGDNA